MKQPPIPAGFATPFLYSSLSHLRTLWSCRPESVDRAKEEMGDHFLPCVGPDGSGVLSVSYQSYLADYGSSALLIRELEIGLLVAPDDGLGSMTVEDYLDGVDATARVGVFALGVMCDQEVGVEAGRKIFGEPKLVAVFEVDQPSPNQEQGNVWRAGCRSRDGAELANLALEVKSGVSRDVLAMTVTNYGIRHDGPVGTRWQVNLPGRSHDPANSVGAIRISTSREVPPALRGLSIEEQELLRVETYVSGAVAIRRAPYYASDRAPSNE